MFRTKKIAGTNVDINRIDNNNFGPYKILKFKEIKQLYHDYLIDYYNEQLPDWELKQVKKASSISEQIKEAMESFEESVYKDYNNLTDESLFIASPKKVKEHWYSGKEGYNPYNESGTAAENKIYLDINKLNLDNDNEIIEFCNKYGPLGADHHPIKIISFDVCYPKKTYIGFKSDAFQSYEMFKFAVEELQGLIEMWVSLQENKLPDLDNTKIWFVKNILKDKNGNLVSLERAKEIFSANINKHLNLTKPHLIANNSNLLPVNKSKTLLAAAYMQFFEDITENKKFKRCKHPLCGDWFPVENTRGREREFCENTNCATNYRSFKSRWKKYFIEGEKTAEEVADRLEIKVEDLADSFNLTEKEFEKLRD
ncbi:MAG: hypothetical protein CI948_2054 [Halanaerobium sp.]|jgi:hypothetical protein|nr:MAG: hypothetical protein CI948_2054 [Halanaerobium sp.]